MAKAEWKNSNCDTLYYDSEADVSLKCRVIIGDGEIEVSYEDEGERLCYRGSEISLGHFELRAVGFEGRATLHQFPSGRILEGYWVEERYKGMWRIQLA